MLRTLICRTDELSPLTRISHVLFISLGSLVARWLRAKIWTDCAIPDTSMKFGTVVDHN